MYNTKNEKQITTLLRTVRPDGIILQSEIDYGNNNYEPPSILYIIIILSHYRRYTKGHSMRPSNENYR